MHAPWSARRARRRCGSASLPARRSRPKSGSRRKTVRAKSSSTVVDGSLCIHLFLRRPEAARASAANHRRTLPGSDPQRERAMTLAAERAAVIESSTIWPDFPSHAPPHRPFALAALRRVCYRSNQLTGPTSPLPDEGQPAPAAWIPHGTAASFEAAESEESNAERVEAQPSSIRNHPRCVTSVFARRRAAFSRYAGRCGRWFLRRHWSRYDRW